MTTGDARTGALERLPYHPPFDWPGLAGFLSTRALAGVERVGDDGYLRTVRVGEHEGWVRVRHAPEQCALLVEATSSLAPALPSILSRLRHLFDLDARPDAIAERLGADALLADAVARNPGLRVPGAFDGFELAVRAVLGQQVTVRAAATLAGRFARAFGEPVRTPHPELDRLSPGPERVAGAAVEEIASLGIIRTRARSILALADAVASGRLRLEAGAEPEATMRQLVALPGIGPWTAHYVAMRALRWSDAFPKEDVALRKSLGGVTAARAESLSQAWRPWRSYATLYLWQRPIRSADADPAPPHVHPQPRGTDGSERS